jgi:hypothetical protein
MLWLQDRCSRKRYCSLRHLVRRMLSLAVPIACENRAPRFVRPHFRRQFNKRIDAAEPIRECSTFLTSWTMMRLQWMAFTCESRPLWPFRDIELTVAPGGGFVIRRLEHLVSRPAISASAASVGRTTAMYASVYARHARNRQEPGESH